MPSLLERFPPIVGTGCAGARELHLRSIARHHDGRGDSEPAGRERDRLSVVARRKRDHGALSFLELQQPVEGAADLETAGMLETFGLEQHADTGTPVDLVRLEHGSIDDPPAHALRGGENVG